MLTQASLDGEREREHIFIMRWRVDAQLFGEPIGCLSDIIA